MPHRSNSVTASKISLNRSSTFRSGYNSRMVRKTSGPIMRAHHWGFMSLRPAPPLKTQQLLSLRDVSVTLSLYFKIIVSTRRGISKVRNQEKNLFILPLRKASYIL